MALCLYIWYAYMCVCCIRQTQGFSLRVNGLIRGLVIAIFRCFSKEAKKVERNFNRMHVCIYKHERARVCIYVCLCLFVYLIKILALLCTLSIMCARWDGVYCVDFVCSPNVNFSTHIQIYFGNVDGPCPLCLRIKCEYTSNLNGTKPSISSHRMYCILNTKSWTTYLCDALIMFMFGIRMYTTYIHIHETAPGDSQIRCYWFSN